MNIRQNEDEKQVLPTPRNQNSTLDTMKNKDSKSLLDSTNQNQLITKDQIDISDQFKVKSLDEVVSSENLNDDSKETKNKKPNIELEIIENYLVLHETFQFGEDITLIFFDQKSKDDNFKDLFEKLYAEETLPKLLEKDTYDFKISDKRTIKKIFEELKSNTGKEDNPILALYTKHCIQFKKKKNTSIIEIKTQHLIKIPRYRKINNNALLQAQFNKAKQAAVHARRLQYAFHMDVFKHRFKIEAVDKAKIIQSWWRAIKVNNLYYFLATKIQSTFRKYLIRKSIGHTFHSIHDIGPFAMKIENVIFKYLIANAFANIYNLYGYMHFGNKKLEPKLRKISNAFRQYSIKKLSSEKGDKVFGKPIEKKLNDFYNKLKNDQTKNTKSTKLKGKGRKGSNTNDSVKNNDRIFNGKNYAVYDNINPNDFRSNFKKFIIDKYTFEKLHKLSGYFKGMYIRNDEGIQRKIGFYFHPYLFYRLKYKDPSIYPEKIQKFHECFNKLQVFNLRVNKHMQDKPDFFKYALQKKIITELSKKNHILYKNKHHLELMVGKYNLKKYLHDWKTKTENGIKLEQMLSVGRKQQNIKKLAKLEREKKRHNYVKFVRKFDEILRNKKLNNFFDRFMYGCKPYHLRKLLKKHNKRALKILLKNKLKKYKLKALCASLVYHFNRGRLKKYHHKWSKDMYKHNPALNLKKTARHMQKKKDKERLKKYYQRWWDIYINDAEFRINRFKNKNMLILRFMKWRNTSKNLNRLYKHLDKTFLQVDKVNKYYFMKFGKDYFFKKWRNINKDSKYSEIIGDYRIKLFYYILDDEIFRRRITAYMKDLLFCLYMIQNNFMTVDSKKGKSHILNNSRLGNVTSPYKLKGYKRTAINNYLDISLRIRNLTMLYSANGKIKYFFWWKKYNKLCKLMEIINTNNRIRGIKKYYKLWYSIYEKDKPKNIGKNAKYKNSRSLSKNRKDNLYRDRRNVSPKKVENNNNVKKINEMEKTIQLNKTSNFKNLTNNISTNNFSKTFSSNRNSTSLSKQNGRISSTSRNKSIKKGNNKEESNQVIKGKEGKENKVGSPGKENKENLDKSNNEKTNLKKEVKIDIKPDNRSIDRKEVVNLKVVNKKKIENEPEKKEDKNKSISKEEKKIDKIINTPKEEEKKSLKENSKIDNTKRIKDDKKEKEKEKEKKIIKEEIKDESQIKKLEASPEKKKEVKKETNTNSFIKENSFKEEAKKPELNTNIKNIKKENSFKEEAQKPELNTNIKNIKKENSFKEEAKKPEINTNIKNIKKDNESSEEEEEEEKEEINEENKEEVIEEEKEKGKEEEIKKDELQEIKEVELKEDEEEFNKMNNDNQLNSKTKQVRIFDYDNNQPSVPGKTPNHLSRVNSNMKSNTLSVSSELEKINNQLIINNNYDNKESNKELDSAAKKNIKDFLLKDEDNELNTIKAEVKVETPSIDITISQKEKPQEEQIDNKCNIDQFNSISNVNVNISASNNDDSLFPKAFTNIKNEESNKDIKNILNSNTISVCRNISNTNSQLNSNLNINKELIKDSDKNPKNAKTKDYSNKINNTLNKLRNDNTMTMNNRKNLNNGNKIYKLDSFNNNTNSMSMTARNMSKSRYSNKTENSKLCQTSNFNNNKKDDFNDFFRTCKSPTNSLCNNNLIKKISYNAATANNRNKQKIVSSRLRSPNDRENKVINKKKEDRIMVKKNPNLHIQNYGSFTFLKSNSDIKNQVLKDYINSPTNLKEFFIKQNKLFFTPPPDSELDSNGNNTKYKQFGHLLRDVDRFSNKYFLNYYFKKWKKTAKIEDEAMFLFNLYKNKEEYINYNKKIKLCRWAKYCANLRILSKVLFIQMKVRKFLKKTRESKNKGKV